jgi:hypothetical protein
MATGSRQGSTCCPLGDHRRDLSDAVSPGKKITGGLNKLLREASYVRVSPLEQKRVQTPENSAKSESCNPKQSSRSREPPLEELQNGRLRPPMVFWPSSARISAVDDEIASGEITARIGCKIHHDGRGLARFADAAHRREFYDHTSLGDVIGRLWLRRI